MTQNASEMTLRNTFEDLVSQIHPSLKPENISNLLKMFNAYGGREIWLSLATKFGLIASPNAFEDMTTNQQASVLFNVQSSLQMSAKSAVIPLVSAIARSLHAKYRQSVQGQNVDTDFVLGEDEVMPDEPPEMREMRLSRTSYGAATFENPVQRIFIDKLHRWPQPYTSAACTAVGTFEMGRDNETIYVSAGDRWVDVSTSA